MEWVLLDRVVRSGGIKGRAVEGWIGYRRVLWGHMQRHPSSMLMDDPRDCRIYGSGEGWMGKGGMVYNGELWWRDRCLMNGILQSIVGRGRYCKD